MNQLRDERGRFVGSILTWGVELEGGFDPDRNWERVANRLDWSVEWDESVDTWAENQELVSPVYDKLHLLKRDLKELYSYLVDANNSMGFHIHIGVPRPVYYLLSSWGFVNFFQNAVIGKFPQIRGRLNNHFCVAWKGYDWPSNHTLQVQAPGKYSPNGNDRYKAINYCYGLHKTIEFRLFPATEYYTTAFAYLDFVKWSVGEWVSTHELDPITESAEPNIEDMDEAIVDLRADIPKAEPENLEDHFENVLGGLVVEDILPDGFDGPFGTGQTRAELEGRLVYPHAPGCQACDHVRWNNEAQILEVYHPAPGAQLRMATHIN